MGENDSEESSLPSSPKDETPIKAVVRLKRDEDMKFFEETEDCFILEFDPSESVDLSKLSMDKNNNHASAHDGDAADLSVNAEKGPVACRDYPHPRHLCLKFPFNTTPHENYCEMCYCYACDSAAPCQYWLQPNAWLEMAKWVRLIRADRTERGDLYCQHYAWHCDAGSAGYWKDLRNMKKHGEETHI